MGKILIIDDEPKVIAGIQECLQDAGYQVLYAADGQAGLEVAKAEKPACILLDIIMPKMSGMEVLKALKDDANLKDIPVIMSTVVEQMDMISEATALGACGYFIKKEWQAAEICARIAKVLGNK